MAYFQENYFEGKKMNFDVMKAYFLGTGVHRIKRCRKSVFSIFVEGANVVILLFIILKNIFFLRKGSHIFKNIGFFPPQIFILG